MIRASIKFRKSLAERIEPGNDKGTLEPRDPWRQQTGASQSDARGFHAPFGPDARDGRRRAVPPAAITSAGLRVALVIGTGAYYAAVRARPKPVDVRLRAGGNFTDGMVDMDTILAALDDEIRTNILIFEACRNNPNSPLLGEVYLAAKWK